MSRKKGKVVLTNRKRSFLRYDNFTCMYEKGRGVIEKVEYLLYFLENTDDIYFIKPKQK